MPNIYDHDSLQRIEPTARFVAEQAHKTEDDQILINLQNQKEFKERTEQTNESSQTDLSGTDGKHDENAKQHAAQKQEKVTHTDLPPPRFWGGQILDTQA